MKNSIKATLLFLLLAEATPAQISPSSDSAWQVSICPVKLLNQPADFNGSFRYSVRTDINGVPTTISRISESALDKFVDTTKFTPCIKQWRLEPTEDYSVTFGVGTIMFDKKPNYILVSNKSKTVKIVLPEEIFEWAK